MAGSYNHLIGGWSMIENMGDARECVEELFWLVESQIGRPAAEIMLERFRAMARGDEPRDHHMIFVQQQMSK